MTFDVNSALMLALFGVTIGCMKYVHDRTDRVYKGQAEFEAGWTEWRVLVAGELGAIKAILKERKEEKG